MFGVAVVVEIAAAFAAAAVPFAESAADVLFVVVVVAVVAAAAAAQLARCAERWQRRWLLVATAGGFAKQNLPCPYDPAAKTRRFAE